MNLPTRLVLIATVVAVSAPAFASGRKAVNPSSSTISRELHANWPFRFGASEQQVRASFERAGKRRTHLTISDISPSAFFAGRNRVPESTHNGFKSIEFKNKTHKLRVLFIDDQVFRVIVTKAKTQMFHQRLRSGLKRSQVMAILGEADESRSLIHDREILSWQGREIEVVVTLKGDKVKSFWVQNARLAEEAQVRLWGEADEESPQQMSSQQR